MAFESISYNCPACSQHGGPGAKALGLSLGVIGAGDVGLTGSSQLLLPSCASCLHYHPVPLHVCTKESLDIASCLQKCSGQKEITPTWKLLA